MPMSRIRATLVLLVAMSVSSVGVSQSASVTITGTIRDNRGLPVQTAISVDAMGLGDQGWVMSSSTGRYSIRVQEADQYIVTVNPLRTDWQHGYSFPYQFMAEKQHVFRSGVSITANFNLEPAATLWLRAFDTTGTELTRREFSSTWIGTWAPDELPIGPSQQAESSSHPLFWGWIENSVGNTACMMVPAMTPAVVWAMWHVPGAGTTFLHADNGGEGYCLRQGEIHSINLVYEFAATELREFHALLSSSFTHARVVPPGTAARLEDADAQMQSAETAMARNDWQLASLHAYQVLENVILAREEVEIAAAEAAIPESRHVSVTVSLVNDEGEALANAHVTCEQASSEFVLSIGWPEPRQYDQFVAAGFNHACFESWWGEIRHSNGTYAYPYDEVSSLAGAGLGTVMHASVWLSPAYPQGVPASAAAMPVEDLVQVVGEYSSAVVGNLAGRITLYNALNEPDLDQVRALTLSELLDVATSSAAGAKDADPDVLTYVNIGAPLMGQRNVDPVTYLAARDMHGNTLPGRVSFPSPETSGLEFLRALYLTPNQVDVTGLEFYYGVVMPPIDLGLFSRILDAYGELGKPVFISELSYATLDDYAGLVKYWSSYGGWHDGYTDEAQASWASSALTIAYSKPYVMGVQWVAANDGAPEYDFVGDGLYHRYGSRPRPALNAIGELLGDWMLVSEDRTDAEGAFTLDGPAGGYALLVTTEDGQVYRASISVRSADDGDSLAVTCHPEGE